jgi:hypothetical protein
VINTFEVDAFPRAFAVETDDFEPVGDFTRMTARWTYQRSEDRDKMGGPEMKGAVTTIWENVEELLEKGWPEAIGPRA